MFWMDVVVWVEIGLVAMLCHDSGLGKKEQLGVDDDAADRAEEATVVLLLSGGEDVVEHGILISEAEGVKVLDDDEEAADCSMC
jgi:hypothetical protein